MKFSAVALPLFALLAHQAAAVVLPLTDNVSAELEARHVSLDSNSNSK
jgi:hypothetical protein